MFELLVKLFVKNSQDVSDPDVRTAYGMISGITGIILNFLLFLLKYIVGIISGSVAVIADAFNNLSDAGSSVITILGFRLAATKPDEEHPFGHGRVEYLSALAVSVLIIIMGVEVGKTSVSKIFAPELSAISPVMFLVLGFSILVKFYMFTYNKKYGELLDSSVLRATATDSLSDSISTFAVLVSAIVFVLFDIDLDGYCGVLVALFILKAGFESISETVSDLLGRPPSPEFINKIENIVLSHEEVIGMHDLIVHDYGNGRVMISLHGEVPANGNIFVLHDVIDNIERELTEKLGCKAVIHMDPISTDDETVAEMKNVVLSVISDIDPSLTIHDFRIVTGQTHTNLIFDVVVPYKFSSPDSELKRKIEDKVREKLENCYCVINIDKPYI